MRKTEVVDKAVENVDNSEFLTVSTGFSTGGKKGKKLGAFQGSLHKILASKIRKPDFFALDHFDNRVKTGSKIHT